MARPKTTFGKYERERTKKQKAKAKQEERLARRDEPAVEAEDAVAPAADQTALLDAFAKLHERYAEGLISDDDFEIKVEEMRAQMRVD